MVRAHRQAWCWQDEWYGLTIEDIRQLEKEAQLMLAQKMAQFCSENDTEQHGVKDNPGEKDVEASTVSPVDTEDAAGNSETASGRSLTKQWSTSSKSSRSSKRGGKMLLLPCCSELHGRWVFGRCDHVSSWLSPLGQCRFLL